jgi:hypothetical protein
MQRLFLKPKRFQKAMRLQMQRLRHDEERNEGSFRNPFDWDVATGKPRYEWIELSRKCPKSEYWTVIEGVI